MNLVQIAANEFPNSLFSILANHPLPHRKSHGFFFVMSTLCPRGDSAMTLELCATVLQVDSPK
jgi:hypothetical protein